jgi:hypothetical protein
MLDTDATACQGEKKAVNEQVVSAVGEMVFAA